MTSLYHPYTNYADYLLARTGRIEQAIDTALDSLGNKIPSSYYPGEALNAVDDNGNLVGSLLFRMLGDVVWVDSIYSTKPAEAMEMFTWMRANFPGRQVEGRFDNKRLQGLVERYNRSMGFEPWEEADRWREADNTYALMGHTASLSGSLINPNLWHPKREEAWLRAWEAAHEPWVSNDWTTASLRLAVETTELAQKMVESILDRPDMKQMKEYHDENKSRAFEMANWLSPLQPFLERMRAEHPRYMDDSYFLSRQWMDSIDDRRKTELVDKVGRHAYNEMFAEVRDSFSDPNIDYSKYPAIVRDNPNQPTPEEKQYAAFQQVFLRNQYDWDTSLKSVVRSYGWPDSIREKMPDIAELQPGDGLHENDPKKRELEAATQALSNIIKSGIKKQQNTHLPMMYSRLKTSLLSVARNAPDAYKMYPWMVKHLKQHMNTSIAQGGGPEMDVAAMNAVTDYGPLLKRYQDEHKLPKGFDLNKMNPEQFNDWASEELSEPHEDSSRVVFTYPDGWTIRQLDPDHPDDWEAEGEQMNNCLKDYESEQAGGYGWLGKGDSGYSTFFSLRTPKNKPKVSMEAVGPEGSSRPQENSWPYALTLCQKYSNSNRRPAGELHDRLEQWFAALEQQGVHVKEGNQDRGYYGDDGIEEREPDHLEDLDEWEEHPDGNFYIDELQELRQYGDELRHNAGVFNSDNMEADQHEDEDRNYWYTHYNGREVENPHQEKSIADEIAVNALESETEEDQAQVFEDLENLHAFVAHSLHQSGASELAEDNDEAGYRRYKGAEDYDKDIIGQLQETLKNALEMRQAGLPSYVWDWDTAKSNAQVHKMDIREFISQYDYRAVSDNQMTDVGFKILNNLIAFAQKLANEVTGTAPRVWPESAYRGKWVGLERYDAVREAHAASLPPLPQYEHLYKPWGEVNGEPHYQYPEGPGGQQTFLEKPADLRPPGDPNIHDPNYVPPDEIPAGNQGQMAMDTYAQNLERTPFFQIAQHYFDHLPGGSASMTYDLVSAAYPGMVREGTLTPEIWATAWNAVIARQQLPMEQDAGGWR